MSCPGCGRQGFESYCSNACFVRSRTGRAECELCQLDRRTGRRGNLSATKLCSACAADPANADWIERRELLTPFETEDAAELALERHAELIDKKLRQVTPTQQQILELAITGQAVRLQRWARRGRKKVRNGTYEGRRPLSLREIARRARCSHTYVGKVIRRQLEA